MILPFRHIEAPFDLNTDEWAELGAILLQTRERLAAFSPDGFTIGWNVGAVAGQEVFPPPARHWTVFW